MQLFVFVGFEVDAAKKLAPRHVCWIRRVDELIFPENDLNNLLTRIMDFGS